MTDEKKAEEKADALFTPNLKQVNDYVSKQLSKHELTTTKGLSVFLTTLFNTRRLILMVMSHFLDIASDIAVAWEWYSLWQKQKNNLNQFMLRTVI